MPTKTAKVTILPAEDAEIGLGWLGETIGFNLRIAQESSVRAYLRSVADTGTLQWRFAILSLIHDNPGLTQRALGDAIKRDTSSLTPALDDLCKRELVTRIRPARDRRSYELRLTVKGQAAMEKLKVHVKAHEAELDRLMTKDQRKRLIETLRTIAAAFEES